MQLRVVQRQSLCQRVKCSDVVVAWLGQNVNLTLWRCDYAVLVRIGKVCDGSRCSNQDKLTKVLKLLDRHLKDILKPFYGRDASTTLHARKRIGRKQLRASGRSDAPCSGKTLAEKRL